MANSDSSVLLNLYVQIAPAELFRLLQRQSGQIVRNGIYSARLVIWMMMNQRLQAGGTLARSVVQLEYGAELVKAYPQAQNGRGKSHRPVVRMVVLHDVDTGLAERPYWGPMYGPRAVSEQALGEQATKHVPAGSVIIGDRNFGIF